MSETLNYEEAANYIGIPLGTLYCWVNKKQIPHFRYGPRSVRFSKAQLDKWLKNHQVEISNASR